MMDHPDEDFQTQVLILTHALIETCKEKSKEPTITDYSKWVEIVVCCCLSVMHYHLNKLQLSKEMLESSVDRICEAFREGILENKNIIQIQ